MQRNPNGFQGAPKESQRFPSVVLASPLLPPGVLLEYSGFRFAPNGATKGPQRVPKGFPKGFQGKPNGFQGAPKESQRFPSVLLASPWSPLGLLLASLWTTRASFWLPMELPRGSKGFPRGFQRISKGFPRGGPKGSQGSQGIHAAASVVTTAVSTFLSLCGVARWGN